MEKKYISYKFLRSLSGWREKWFYIGNHMPSLPGRTARALQITCDWSKPAGMKPDPESTWYDKKAEGCGRYWCSGDVLVDP
jgi:hypothetical protein